MAFLLLPICEDKLMKLLTAQATPEKDTSKLYLTSYNRKEKLKNASKHLQNL